MHSENKELAKAGHELAKCLDSNTPLTEIAKLIARLATALDVTTLAVREATKQLDQVAQAVGWVEGGNFTLAETVGGHVSGLKAAAKRSEELAAENAALKSKGRELLNEACGVYEKYNATINPENGDFMDGQTLHEFQFLMDVETPATDAILREVRASAVDAVCLKISKAIASCRQDEMIGLDEAVNIASDFAAQLRKGGAA
ncbi:hypothetical protein [Cronobacter sakazakii]|uniref:hypothetical protein n=1 Tax=Cronobacter sakazakii TaxID=28141 RepID=UPI001AEA4C21|nr:hypothetical protein [Cronobacter sakazakii]